METYYIPDMLMQFKTVIKNDVLFFNYQSDKTTINNKIILTKYIICFLHEGHKEVHTDESTLKIDCGEAFILSSGNCLMSEKTSLNNKYRSFLIFFDNELLKDFLLRYGAKISYPVHKNGKPVTSFSFTQDAFVKLYLQSVNALQDIHGQIPLEMARLKLEELLLYLLESHSELFARFIDGTWSGKSEMEFKTIIETHIDLPHSVEELAFLCNMSLSTFKRRFQSAYGASPNHLLHQKRMQRAALMLKSDHQLRPSDIFMTIGYDSLSSFTYAFRQKFGQTPKQFQKG